MSQSDSFIDEVTEEVRKDRLFALMRRYAWVAVLGVLLIVGGAAYNEWRKAQERNAAQALGDSVLSALEIEDEAGRAAALAAIEASNPASQAVIDLLAAAELAPTDPVAAGARLLALADNPEALPVHRQIATLKATALPGSGMSDADRQTRLEGLALSGGMTRLLAEEQLALIEIGAGDTDAALARLQGIVQDAGVSASLQRRAAQVIVALGGELPDDAQVEEQGEE